MTSNSRYFSIKIGILGTDSVIDLAMIVGVRVQKTSIETAYSSVGDEHCERVPRRDSGVAGSTFHSGATASVPSSGWLYLATDRRASDDDVCRHRASDCGACKGASGSPAEPRTPASFCAIARDPKVRHCRTRARPVSGTPGRRGDSASRCEFSRPPRDPKGSPGRTSLFRRNGTAPRNAWPDSLPPYASAGTLGHADTPRCPRARRPLADLLCPRSLAFPDWRFTQ